MAYQTKMNGIRFPEEKRLGASKASAGHFMRQAIELCELQFQLLLTDLKAATGSAKFAALSFLIAIGLLIAAAPVLLMALAGWIELQFQLSAPLSLLISGIAAIVFSGLLLLIGWYTLRGGVAKLNRSAEEFKRNMEWAKHVVSSRDEPEHYAAEYRRAPK